MKASIRCRPIALWFARLALAAGFLSAVADRFGLWGQAGNAGVVWGDWEHFVAYSASLNSFVPDALQTPIAMTATLAEVILPIGLLIPQTARPAAVLSGCLLLVFGFVMVVSSGVKAPLDYSVFSAAAAAFLLSVFPVSEVSPSPHEPIV